METLASSCRQRPPPTETEEMVPSLSRPSSNLMGAEPEQQDREMDLDGDGMLPALSAHVLPADVVRVNIPNHASRPTSIEPTRSECMPSTSSAGGDDLKPPLVVGLNSRIINEAQNVMPRSENQHGGINHERVRLGSAATSSAHSMAHREVLVMSKASELSTASSPTPLGRPRRLSLFERANSISVPFNEESGEYDVPHAKSDRSNSSAMVKGRNIRSSGLDESRSDHDQSSALGRDKYNTVLRDWLMNVLEKDDQQNAEVRDSGPSSG